MKKATISAKATLLWHLLEEGTVTRADLVRLTGWTYAYTASAISECLQKTWAQRTDVPHRKPAVYGLTALGIEEAVKVTREQVVFASHTETTAETSTELKQMSPGSTPAPDTLTLQPNEATMESPRNLVIKPVELADCALTWQHELWLDLDNNIRVKLAADQARKLKRFLVTSDLGESTGGAA